MSQEIAASQANFGDRLRLTFTDGSVVEGLYNYKPGHPAYSSTLVKAGPESYVITNWQVAKIERIAPAYPAGTVAWVRLKGVGEYSYIAVRGEKGGWSQARKTADGGVIAYWQDANTEVIEVIKNGEGNV